MVERSRQAIEGAAALLAAGLAAIAAVAVAGIEAPAAPSPPPPAAAVDLGRADAVIAVGGEVSLSGPLAARAAAGRLELSAFRALAGADAAVVQLAGPVAAVGDAAPEAIAGSELRVRGRPESIAILTGAGIDAVAAAGDHIGDYGSAAMAATREHLEAAGLATAGLGGDADRACAPAYVAAGDLTVALISIEASDRAAAAGACFVPLEPAAGWTARLAAPIAAARRGAHIVLVAVRFAGDDAARPSRSIRAAAAAIARAGADAVLASSSRAPQGIEIAGGVPVLYDLGDLLVDPVGGRGRRALLAELAVGAEGARGLRLTPIEINSGRAERSRGARARVTLLELAARSAELGTAIAVGDGAATIALPRRPPRPDPSSPAPVASAGVSPDVSPADPLAAEPPQPCTVAEVPSEARREPRRVGPYRLLGARLRPASLGFDDMLWVESFWELAGKPGPADQIGLEARAVRGWSRWQGRRGDHDPCDWAWPTGRWVPGVIYRDLFALPPPADVETAELEVRLGVRRRGKRLGKDVVIGRLWQRAD